ncbi:hypothetical protein QN277_000235 [Acacia crassicarpa]|uniref:Uncharacterized protein n=1 Tax=Acacia crassicarpa TaxID=499986 RepID=A0AAE1TGX8_9FABA|nr:hypothetical protein QN277_000235 [Acacia crassicarpa]
MPARSLITTLSFLLWFSLSLASASEHAVIDNDGEPLVPGQEYYITSAIRGAGGGGVFPVKTGDLSSCEYSITQASSDLDRGTLVKFHVSGVSTDKIYLGWTFLEIDFVEKPTCAESSKWAAAPNYAGSSLYRLVIGDTKSVSGYFQIQGLNSFSYKLVFCPGSVKVVPPTCYDIGMETNRVLVVNHDDTGNDAKLWVFEKAQSVKGKFSII